MNLEFLEIASLRSQLRILRLNNEIASVALLPRNDAENSRIPYRDPPKALGDDIVGNSRIPS